MSKEYRKRPKALHKKNIKKYFVLPVCILILNIIEEIIVYKSRVIENEYLKTACILFFFIVGVAIISLALSPLFEKILSSAYFGSRKHAGYLGEFLTLVVTLCVLYIAYYYAYAKGAEYLLPVSWR